MPFSFVAEGSHLHRHAAQPLQQIQLVRTLVQQHAATFSVPGRLPARRIIIALITIPVGDDPVDTSQLPKFAALDHFVKFSVYTVGSLI